MIYKDFKIPVGNSVSQWMTHQDIFGEKWDTDGDKYALAGIVCPSSVGGITSVSFESEYGGATKSLKDVYGVSFVLVTANDTEVIAPIDGMPMIPRKIRIKGNVNASGSDAVFSVAFRKIL